MKRVKIIKAKIAQLQKDFPPNEIRPPMVVATIETLYWVLDNNGNAK